MEKTLQQLGLKPAEGYTWNDLWWSFAKGKRFPRHPQTDLYRKLGLQPPDVSGLKISKYSCFIEAELTPQITPELQKTTYVRNVIPSDKPTITVEDSPPSIDLCEHRKFWIECKECRLS